MFLMQDEVLSGILAQKEREEEEEVKQEKEAEE